ncbi:hypothetical protein LSCM1_08267 [Leishmania martiniquensis]|uniref:Uncharacterized protein n=1 Tax=Leishmania martiniquensis TaxID=1580590 RepID=A0A836HKL4_9TRYP|nr:hypothetical protein LSCM1_08267 [Leishmania martiniquensis]
MRRLQRHSIAAASARGRWLTSSTHRCLRGLQEDSTEIASRCCRQRRSVREGGKPSSSILRGNTSPPRRRGCTAAEARGMKATRAAITDVDVDVTVTCSSLMSELQRLFPWSVAYRLWRQRQGQASAASAGSGLSSTAAQSDGCVRSKPLTTDAGHDWRRLFLVRYEPHAALLSATPMGPRVSAAGRCGGFAPAAGSRGERRCSECSRRSEAGICGAPLKVATASESACESRAVQLWWEVLRSAFIGCMESSCPASESQGGDSSHAALQEAANMSMAGRPCRGKGARMPAPGTLGSWTTLGTGEGVRANTSAARFEGLSAAPLPPPLFTWTTPPTYELYHLSEYAHHPRSGAASHADSSPAQPTEPADTFLEHRRRRSDIVHRLRRVGRLHAIPGLPQLPPLLLSRKRDVPSAETLDAAVGCVESGRQRSAHGTLTGVDEADEARSIEGDAGSSVEQEDVLSGTVCSLHDYCQFLSGEGHLAGDEAADGAEGAEHQLPPKGQLTTGSPASSGGVADVFLSASDGASSAAGAAAAASSARPPINTEAPATVFRFAPPLSRAASQTGRGISATNASERWGSLADDGGCESNLSGLDGQRQRLCSKGGAATAGIRPRQICEDVGHSFWNRIEPNAFLNEMLRARRRAQEPRSITAATSEFPQVPRQRVHTVTPVSKRQQQAARTRHERAAATTDVGMSPLPSAPCAASSLMASDTPEAGYSATALSASHGVGVLLAHQHEWISFSVLFHAHAVQPPDTSTVSAARLASDRSLSLSHLYCFSQPPCRLSTEELEAWVHAARRRRRECERVHKRCCGRRRRRDDRPEGGTEVSDRSPPGSAPLPLRHRTTAQTHRTVPRPSSGAEPSRCATGTAREPSASRSAFAAPPTPSPRTWLVYVHPDVSLQTLPRLWGCVFGEDAPSSLSGGREREGGACEAAWDAAGRNEADDDDEEEVGRVERGDQVGHEHVTPTYFHVAVARKRRRQAGEVEMLCRYLLLTPPLLSNAADALGADQAQVPVGSRAHSRGRLNTEASAKATAAVTVSVLPTAAPRASAAAPPRLPAPVAGSPHGGEPQLYQLRALGCALAISPLPRSVDLLKRRGWLTKPFVLAEEMRYGRVVKYGLAELTAPRIL